MFGINFEENTKNICDEIKKQNDATTSFVKEVKEYFEAVPPWFVWDDKSDALRTNILNKIDTYL